MLSLSNCRSKVKEAWQLPFESNDCERAGLCCCDVCWVPKRRPVAYHVSKFCATLPEASLLTCLWPGIVNRYLALLSQEFDGRPSAFSEVLEKWLFITHWVESSPSGDAMYSHPSSLPVFPVVPCFITTVLLLFISAMMVFRVDAVSLWCPAVRC